MPRWVSLCARRQLRCLLGTLHFHDREHVITQYELPGSAEAALVASCLSRLIYTHPRSDLRAGSGGTGAVSPGVGDNQGLQTPDIRAPVKGLLVMSNYAYLVLDLGSDEKT